MKGSGFLVKLVAPLPHREALGLCKRKKKKKTHYVRASWFSDIVNFNIRQHHHRTFDVAQMWWHIGYNAKGS
jgi:hypothetical protein